MAIDPGIIEGVLSYDEGWRYMTNETYRAHMIAACQQQGINTLELQIGPTMFAKLLDSITTVEQSIQVFNAAGIKVWACWNGNDGWDVAVDGHTWHEFIDVVLKWNKDHPTAKFSALGFDLEPPAGSTLEQHSSFLEVVYAGMQTMRAYVVDGTETVASQGLPVVMFNDPRWGGTVCASAWANVCTQLDMVEMEHYRYGSVAQPTPGIDVSIAISADALAIALAAGCYFTVALSNNEIHEEDYADPYASRYDLGVDVYKTHRQVYLDYFASTGKCRGIVHYYDARSWAHYTLIDEITWPSGTFAAGASLPVSYKELRFPYGGMRKAFGVRLEVRDSTGAIAQISQCIASDHSERKTRQIALTLPAMAAGAASMRLSLWAVTFSSGGYDIPMYRNSLPVETLEAMTMEELAAAPYGGIRSTPVLLQDSGWVSGLTLEGAEIPIADVIVGLTPDTYSKSFYVFNTVTNAPISGAAITVGTLTATTDVQGLAVIAGLTSGLHAYTVVATGYTTASGEFTA